MLMSKAKCTHRECERACTRVCMQRVRAGMRMGVHMHPWHVCAEENSVEQCAFSSTEWRLTFFEFVLPLQSVPLTFLMGMMNHVRAQEISAEQCAHI